MRSADFYELVLVKETTRTQSLGVAGMRGIVTGVPPHYLPDAEELNPGEQSVAQYAIQIGDRGFALYREEFEPLGEKVTREALYDGSILRVGPEREPVDDDYFGYRDS